ncbi:MAG: twin-arginine translocase subunit TatC [Gemmatimonadales bacterium]
MSFLDHLEELRIRIFRALGAISLGVVAGWFLVQRFHLVAVLKGPIAPYLPDGKLVVLSPTEPLMIVLKLALIIGCLLASPVVIWQVWGFLSPALYARERRIVVPALIVGVGLFMVGAILAFVYVVPQALSVLFSFQTDSLATMITFEKYFDFVVQLMVAMGISFELPLVIIILASFGLVTPAGLSRFRRVAITLALVAGAILSPGTDIFSMLMLSIPLILLYEVGYLGSIVIWRRKLRVTAAAGLMLFALLGLGPTPLRAQVTPPPPPGIPQVPRGVRDSGDTTRPRPGAKLDSASARRLGLPTAPSQQFPANDSVLDALLGREGYESTRFRADSATIFVPEKRIDLHGRAMTERGGSILEAQRIGYDESSCILDARGDPKVFDQGTVLVGEGLRYNTCERRAVVSEALTNFQENGVDWFMRGNLSQDSTGRRIYAAGSEITSCDLPIPHYHFAARQTKWISKSVLVSRPAVLYVRDVPMLWLPFIFQDGRPGRHSGILVPQFGLNDIVRPSQSYSRQVTNIGYYWAPTDYFDATARFDWYASRYHQWGVGFQYRWLDRFVRGSFGVNRQVRDNGASSLGVRWDHDQSFSLTSTLRLSLDYVSNTEVRNSNAIDPLSNTQEIKSSANYTKRFAWGQFTVGGNRRQSLTDGSVNQQFPAATFSPNPIDIAANLTWSPSVSFTEDRATNVVGTPVVIVLPDGTLDTLGRRIGSRTTNFNLSTPLRIGGFNWSNSIAVTDFYTDKRLTETHKEPDLSTADPNDSVTVTRTTEGDFQTGVDWNTGVNLPVLFRGSWKITPGLGITNATGGPFLIRNARTAGQFVAQTKRPQLTLTSNPTFFAFLPGVGPIDRIRHSVLPTISWSYSPQTDIPEAYARAITSAGQAPRLTALASQTASLGLTQTLEAKANRAPNDTGAISTARKYRLISISTSAISYDFERAKEPGLTGWVTPQISNTFQSDLIPGFNASLIHDLWRGTVGTDSARFAPYLTGVSASFGLSGNTFRSLGHLLGFGSDTSASPRGTEPAPPSYVAQAAGKARPGTFGSNDQIERSGRQAFQSSFNFSLSRQRPEVEDRLPDQVSLGLTTSFSPTAFWSVNWSTQYNFTDARFESQIVRLERDLHEWRASFNFLRNPNGNFAFFFNIALLDLPAVKFDYNQTTLQR